MGSTDKHIFRATLASFVPVRPTGVTWIARGVRGVGPMIAECRTIVAQLGFASGLIQPLTASHVTGKSTARLPQLLGRLAAA
jgi:hypothetical protein